MTEESTDCLKCRLTSGGGLLVGGAYVVHQSKKIKTYSRNIVTLIGYGIGLLGILRIFALPPFRIRSKQQNSKMIEEGEGSEYIIGKIPPKFH